MTQNLPAFLQNYKRGAPSTSLDSLTKMSTGSQPYISIQGNRFRAIDIVGDEQMIGDIDRKTGIAFADIVIIDANDHVSKVYYASEFDPKAVDYLPPDCWSDNGVAPSTQATSPQCRSCAECPHAVWGSDTSKLTGKQTKACSDTKKIAVYVPELPGTAFLMRIPPASLKDLANHAKTLAANGATVAQVLTRVSFKADGVGMMTFQAINWISESIMHDINGLEQAKIDLLVNKADQPRTGELPSPVKPKQITGGGTGNGTPAPNKPPVEPERTQVSPGPAEQESEADILRKQMAELQAKMAAMSDAKADAPKRTRRTKEQIEADKAAEAAKHTSDVGGGGQGMFSTSNETTASAEEKMEIPSFLNGGKAGATTTVTRAGGVAADAPSPDLKAALDAAFSLNLKA